jgi:putative phosphoribosyl transferase
MTPNDVDESTIRHDGLSGWIFTDRVDAGRQLARRLRHLRGTDVVVVGLPRGGVPVAAEVARELRAPLDVIVVRKLGVPFEPELAMGAIGENDIRIMNDDVVRMMGITRKQQTDVEVIERAELKRRAQRFRAGREPVPLAGRVVVIVDDGVATGSTARAACQIARDQGAARIVLAVPVAPVGWEERLAGVADELICVATREFFPGIGLFYADFSQTSDEEVLNCLRQNTPASTSDNHDASPTTEDSGPDPRGRDDEVRVTVDAVELYGRLTVPPLASGVVVFAHGSGSSRHSPRNQLVARVLNQAGLATLLFDLLTQDEGDYRANTFDIDLLAARLAGATEWLRQQPGFAALPIGWFGASTGAAAALLAAAEPDSEVAAVVCRGGRPDLAGQPLSMVRTPTLLIVGALDPVVEDLNREALTRLRCPAEMTVVPGATHLFEEPGTLETVAEMARAWFLTHLSSPAYLSQTNLPGE